jgi:hypothetical protein
VQLGKYAAETFWKNQPPPKRGTFQTFRREDVLTRLATKADLEFISDYYTQPDFPYPDAMKHAPVNRSIPEELNELATLHDVSWKQHNGLYLLRHNRWYRDDLLEVPEVLLKRWATGSTPPSQRQWAEKLQHGKATMQEFRERLELQAEVLNTLTFWQICNGLKWAVATPQTEAVFQKITGEVGPPRPPIEAGLRPHYRSLEYCPFASLADLIMEQSRVLSFYAALDPAQREALLRGQLAFASLTAQQKELALRAWSPLEAAVAQARAPVLLQVIPKNQWMFEMTGVAKARLVIVAAP